MKKIVTILDTKLQQAILDQDCLTPNEARSIAGARGVGVGQLEYNISTLTFRGTGSVQTVILTFPMRKCAGTVDSDYTRNRFRDSYNENIWENWYQWIDENGPAEGGICQGEWGQRELKI